MATRRYTQIPQDTFDAMQLDAGILLKDFDLESAAAGSAGFTDSDFICATTGGITATCQAEYSDLGEDVDNCPNNMMEFVHLDGWTCSLAFTSLSTNADGIKLALGAADVDGTKVTPRRDVKLTDFTDVWWVGDKADGGFLAIHLMNALSSEGFSLKTEKAGKGQTDCTLTGFVSIQNQNVVPMEFYSIEGADESE